jgi:hypothetical protein
MRTNLILFVLVLVNRNFIEDEHEYDDEGRSSDLCLRSSVF